MTTSELYYWAMGERTSRQLKSAIKVEMQRGEVHIGIVKACSKAVYERCDKLIDEVQALGKEHGVKVAHRAYRLEKDLRI